MQGIRIVWGPVKDLPVELCRSIRLSLLEKGYSAVDGRGE
jgi:hypothetical protein